MKIRYCVEPAEGYALEAMVDFIRYSFGEGYTFIDSVPDDVHRTGTFYFIMATEKLTADEIAKAWDYWSSDDHDPDAEWEEIVR